MNRRKYLNNSMAIWVVVLAVASPLAGRTIYVPADFNTIQKAIDDANDTDQIEVAPGTYPESINFNGKAVRLYSSGGSAVTTIDANGIAGAYHVVKCVSGEDANTVLEGFTITGGYANGILLPDNRGGGMLNMSSSPTVSNCVFISNRAYGAAGGMYNNDSSPTLSYCDFNDNAAQFAGAMMNCQGSRPTLTNCTFSDNEALYALGTGYPYGGGMYNVQSSPTLSNCTFQGNSSEATGGGMYNYDTSLTLTNCIFSGNSSVETGGGMENHYSNPTVTDCNFTGNSAYYGGGMENYDTSLTLTNCIFSGNTASYDGGAIDNQFRSNITISNCIFTGNSAVWNDGGAMNNDTSSPTITNCIFTGNSAYDWGGGMRNIYSSSPTLTNCTFSGNTATTGGGMYNYDSIPTVTNCIFWDDTPDEIFNSNSSTTVTYSDLQGGWSGTGNINEDPRFVDADGLDDIFGTEDDNLQLLSDSPCVDKGDNTALPPDTTDLDDDGDTAEPIPFDLAGNPRIVDGNSDGNPVVDMGAYEKAENSPPLACIVGGDRTVEAASNCQARVTLDGSCSSDADSTPATNDDINDFDWYDVVDVCDPNSDILLGSGEIIDCNLSLGEHDIILKVIDKAGAFDINEVAITVEDVTPPVISLNGSAIVILECGVDIYTEEGATATDNCDENVEVVIGGDTVDKSTCGTYLVTYDAADDSGNPADQVTRTVIVQDTMPPEFSLWVEPNVLWPVNHKMVEITPSWEVSDNCDEWPDVSLVSITMNEDAETKGSGHTIGDIWVDANDGIWLRAERSGAGSGRVYTITYQAVDDSNNVTVDSAAVTVPHDMR